MELVDKQQRLKNYLIDTLICSVFTFIFFGITIMVLNFDNKDSIFLDYYIYFFLLLRTIYYIIFEYYFFRTIGKAITKTKVRSIDNTTLTFKQIFIRSLCRLIPLNAFSFLYGSGWHDSISKTIVINDKN